MGELFQKFGAGMREFSIQEYWREEIMGDFFQKFGEDMRQFQKETILAGGNSGGIFPKKL